MDNYSLRDTFLLIENFLLKDSFRMDLLDTVRVYRNEQLWIGGGFVRNLVWDRLHNYTHTELGDIDVFYYNNSELSKDKDVLIESFLNRLRPNIKWSVKNQARMHIHNNENQYTSLEDSLSKFPETASSIVVRLNESDKIEILSPYGFEDLFNLIVKPTNHFFKDANKMIRFQERFDEKRWDKIWPKLILQK